MSNNGDFETVLDKVYDALDLSQQNNEDYQKQVADLHEQLERVHAESQKLYHILQGIWEAYNPGITFENWLEIAATSPEELMNLQNEAQQPAE